MQSARAILPKLCVTVLALGLGSCSCGNPTPTDSGGGADAAPIVTDAGPGATDSGTDAGGGCVPACSATERCLHPCMGAPTCFTPPGGCAAGCSFSCNPCSPGQCGMITATDVECVSCP